MKTDFMLAEIESVTSNTLNDCRNKKIVFTTNNNCKIGLNIPSNRLRSVSNLIEKEWLELSKDTFKLNVKIHIIQDGLSLWQYLL